MRYSPFLVQNPGTPPENVSSPVAEDRTLRRAAIFDKLEGGLVQTGPGDGPMTQDWWTD